MKKKKCLLRWVMVGLLSGWMVTGCGVAPQNSGSSVTSLKLNEFFTASSDGSTEDWLEIYNPTEQEIALEGLQLKDVASGVVWSFPAGSKIAAKGYLQVICDDSGEDMKTNFKLTSKGETIVLQTAEGQEIDAVTYPAQTEDTSWGRSPDGGETWKVTTTPTPGKANE
ncbi:MAG: lamin tail domain-containing protein [Myxococcales bacterium]|nr:lamin tail domain-containing protein [Myxococcales bacterium]